MKIVSKSDLDNMVKRMNTVTGTEAWIYKDMQGIAIKAKNGSNMFSVCGLTRRDALNRCHAFIEGWQHCRDAVMDNWIEERKALHATHDIVGVGAVYGNPASPHDLHGTVRIPCSNTLFVNEGGVA